MSVNDMKPKFTDAKGYREWRASWRELYNIVSEDNRSSKYRLKDLQRQEQNTGPLAKEMKYKRVTAHKLMSALEDAKIRWQSILKMKQGLEEQRATYPVVLDGCKNIDFHFNKKSVEFPFVPAWVVKAKGFSFYVHHVDCNTPWTTRERPDHPSTKGSIRIKKGNITITSESIAVIT